MKPQFHLLATRRFLPLFVTQFLGAFNDNLFKNALIVAVTYGIIVWEGHDPKLLVTLAAGIFMLPFFLFSATAGAIADAYPKALVTRAIKALEIFIVGMVAAGFAIESAPFLFVTLFLMGTHSAFFGPIKYSILPELLSEEELLGGNAFVEAGTFLAILIGTLTGGLLVIHHPTEMLAVSFAAGIFGLAASFQIPKILPKTHTGIRWNLFAQTWDVMASSLRLKSIFPLLLAIAWFWFAGATFLAQFPTYVKDFIGGNEQIVALYLTVFSVGIAIGSLLCNRLLKGHPRLTYAPLGALGMACCMFLFYAVSPGMAESHNALIGAKEYLATGRGILTLIVLLGMAVSGGLYIVPLYAVVQQRAEASHRARIIAASNIWDALLMVLSSVLCLVLLSAGVTVTEIFALTGVATLFVALTLRRYRE